MECVTCVCVWLGRCRWRGGEWMKELGLGFTNPVGMWVCFGCGGVGGLGGEMVWGLDQGRERWCGVMSL